MIEDAHEQHPIEFLLEFGDFIDRQIAKLDLETGDICRKAGLSQVNVIGIDPKYSFGATALHFDRVEPGVAADIEHAHPGQIVRYSVGEASPFDHRIIAQEMIGGRLHFAEMQVVKPCAERTSAALHQV